MSSNVGGEHEAGLTSAVDDFWQWFSAAMAWSLFTLPETGVMILSTKEGHGVQFYRSRNKVVDCEVLYAGEPVPAVLSTGLAADGWIPPNPSGRDNNWSRKIESPAEYGTYEQAASSVTSAMREVLDIPPFAWAVEGWITDHPDTDEFDSWSAIRGLRLMSPPLGELPCVQSERFPELIRENWAALSASKEPGHHQPDWRVSISEGGSRLIRFN